ncbi:SH3 domain protein [Ophiocordyceps camponoti-floridani]|uniref:SH3 domain protein n=1 Tax=Ophiocordyceps camponoti-floridani TaxID=2030778 RepID=A0A8H4VBU6_9HYPO|nr:SH3 domain protein [Ophiocordyceps camponoti-floridani]
MVAPFRVKAVYEYSSPHEDDLNFPVGQVITVTDEEDDDWYGGEYVDGSGTKQEGIFPRNFVEKYEPTAPPRPVRTRAKKDADAVQQQQQQQQQPQLSPEDAAFPPPTAPAQAEPATSKQEPPPPPTLTEAAEAADTGSMRSPVESPTARDSSAAKALNIPPGPASPGTWQPPQPAVSSPVTKSKPAAPPPLTEKPSGNSFKDRIAAFNKPAAPPVAPFKPSGLSGASGSAGFVKKPFVAPPPSRNAYVPPSRDTPSTPIYKREEDADSKERVPPASPEQADKPRAVASGPSQEGEEEEQPKPTSLKERIALLQKQQMDQAQRHADAAAKKEKPKKPPKKRTDQDIATGDATAEAPPPVLTSPREPDDGGARTSTDEARAPPPPMPRRKSSKGPAAESVHDGNDADMSGAGDTTEGQDDTTEREDSDGTSLRVARDQQPTSPTARDEAPGGGEARGEVEEEEVDPEVRRKEELRARMAKMSGGMGFHGMFGAPMPPPAGLRKKSSKPEASTGTDEATSPVTRAAPPIPTLMALPGMGSKAPEEEASSRVAGAPSIPGRPVETSSRDEEEEEEAKTPAAVPDAKSTRRDTGGRGGPPPIPTEGRSARDVKSATEGSESDDELSGRDAPIQSPAQPTRSPPMSPRVAEYPPASPPGASQKRMSRAPPPVPASALAPPRIDPAAPPPPPVATDEVAMPPRPAQAGDEENEENTEYEGDYDTDIASSVPHKDALKAHARESSVDDKTETPRGAPPPIPWQPAPAADGSKRRSMEAVREDDERATGASNRQSYLPKADESLLRGGPSAPPPDRRLPSIPSRAPGRPSMDAGRASMSGGRQSMDMIRTSSEGFIASDLDLSPGSGWWKQPMQVPPALQGRRDVLYETDESATTNQGSKTIVTREIYVLFQDYSQTVVTARFDPYRTSEAADLEQRHDSPPRPLRQDQMEEFHERYGVQLLAAAAAAKDTVVGDGTAQGLVTELLRPLKGALGPVGTRAYGALVYSNMANASTQQHDVIRPGDIMSARNARFQGKHGPMHAKYTTDVGKPDHVAVVAEWDGTKKKVKAWEQGRESKKVKLESFRLDDLRSGEVKIWRVVPRSWVGWSG